MASIRKRDESDDATSFLVLFRAGGARNARQESEVFDDDKAAERFRNLVEVPPLVSEVVGVLATWHGLALTPWARPPASCFLL